MAAAALTLWGLHLAINLVLRVAVQRRRIGTSGVVGVTGRLGAAEAVAAAAEALAIGLGVAAPVLDLTGGLDPLDALDSAWLRWTGFPIGVAAVAGVALSQRAMGRSWRIGVDQERHTGLVTSGPFRYARHPIYSCFVLLLLGVALLVPNLLACGAVLTVLVFVQVQARAVEEPWLLREHGEAYTAYNAVTGRFVPGIGRLGSADRARRRPGSRPWSSRPSRRE
jgi:protein-S-isoprenylcysteine O-methyltransferase Ste14